MKVAVEKKAAFQGHKDSIFALAGDYDSSRFYTAGGDGLIAEWDIEKPGEGTLLAKLDGSSYTALFERNRNKLIVAQNHLGVHLIDLDSRKHEKSIQLSTCPFYSLLTDGNLLFAGGGNGIIYMLDLTTYELKHQFKLSDKSCRTLAKHPTEPIIAAGYSDNNIYVISLKTHEVYPIKEAHRNSVFCLSFSPDGKYLISGGRDAHLNIWSTDDWSLHENIVAHMYTINFIEFAKDGRHFATASKDKTIKIWDAGSFQLLKVIDKPRHGGHGNSVNKLLWKKRERQLVSCSDDRSAMVWRLQFNEL
ncbi:MAG TPA: hypothetical protein DDY13_04660 [Cytophagales bacterium]|jgi:WD repeat-containing protein 61|nr:hypothetical protein [Cytophagales bacterium]